MPQIFHRSMNTVSRVSIFGAAFFALGGITLGYMFMQSPYQTAVKVVRDQPVPFPHEHHVRDLGIDCRYCHNSVETTANAGMPATDVCMSCHSQIFADSPMLAPVRESLASNVPIKWAKIHDIPDFVYFHHGIHVQKGIGCTECHGRVDQMPLMWKAQPMTMQWCLECHRNPAEHIRPRDQVFVMDYEAPEGKQLALGRELVAKYHIEVGRLTNCAICHR